MQVSALKRTTLNRIVGMALVVGLIVSVALNVAMLTRSHDGTVRVGDAPAADAQRARLARFDAAKQHQLDAVQPMVAARTTVDTQMRQFYAHKELKLDEFDAAQAALSRQALLDARTHRFYAHKELQLDQADAAQGQSYQRSALTPSQQHFVDLKSDQIDGIVAGQ